MPASLSELGLELIGRVPPWLAGANDAQAVIDALAREVERFDVAKALLEVNYYPNTAEAQLAVWERTLGLTVAPPDKTLVQRRSSVLAFLGALTSGGTGYRWEEILTSLIGTAWSYEEHVPVASRVTNLVANPSAETAIESGVTTGSSTTPVNLVTNPSFEVDTAGWSVLSVGALSRITSWAAAGLASMRWVGTADFAHIGLTTPVPVAAGQQVMGRAIANVTANLSSGIFLNFEWYDQAGSATLGQTSGTAFTGTGVTTLSHSVTAPAGAVSFRVRLIIQGTSAAFDVAVDAIQAHAGVTALPAYFDGSTAPANLIANSSFETSVTAAAAGTSTRSNVWSKFGSWSVLASGPAGTGLIYNHLVGGGTIPVTAGKTYTCSAYINKVDTVGRGVRLYVDTIGVAAAFNSPDFSGTGETRLSVTFTAPAGTTAIYLSVQEVNDGAAKAPNFYWDGAMLHEGSAPLAYFEGTPPSKYRWTGTAHASTSAPALATYTRVTGVWAKAGTYSRRHRVIHSDAAAVIGSSTPFGTAGVPVTPGRYYGARASAYVERMDTAITLLRAGIYWFNAAGAYVTEGSGPSVTPALTAPYDAFVVGQAPATAAFGAVFTTYSVSPGGVMSEYIVHGDALALFDLGTAVKPVGAGSLAADVPAYFDGATSGYEWSGTAHASTSRKVSLVNPSVLRIVVPFGSALSVVTGLGSVAVATGGTLAAGTYFYVVTAMNSYGETPASAEISRAVTGSTSKIEVTWGAISRATGYRVYRGTTSGQWLRLATIEDSSAVSYMDVGGPAVAPAPPTLNTTVSPFSYEARVLARRITPAHLELLVAHGGSGFVVGESPVGETFL